MRSRAVAGELGALVRRRMFVALMGCRMGGSVRTAGRLVARLGHAEVKMCKYGRDCHRGACCTFAHTNQELGKKIDPLPEGEKYREDCSFWASRVCTKAVCPFIHDEPVTVPCPGALV